MSTAASRRNSPARSWVRPLLSVFILFHLAAVVLGPNGRNYWGNALGFVLEPYANFLGFVSNWSFFAPDPGPPPHFIEYEIYGNAGKLIAQGQLPESKNPFFFSDRQNRRVVQVRYMLANWERAEKMLVPYLCRTHSGARSVQLWQVFHPVPPLWDVASGKKTPDDPQNDERKPISTTFCPDSDGRSNP